MAVAILFVYPCDFLFTFDFVR